MPQNNPIKEIISRWPNRQALADDLGDKTKCRVDKWAQTGAIPSRELQKVLNSAEKHGISLSASELIEAQCGEKEGAQQ